MIWFTADQHLNHTNIIKYCNRPFKDVNEMDTKLIFDWNSIIRADDCVFHLGDLCLGNLNVASIYIPRLNGTIHLLANDQHHDRRWLNDFKKYNYPMHRLILEAPLLTLEPSYPRNNVPIVLCHFPLAEWDRKHYGAWHLHGHSHGTYKAEGKILDVGVDSAYKLLGAYRPFSMMEVSEIMATL